MTLGRYVFAVDQAGICTEQCPQSEQVKIGSTSCTRCVNCVGFDQEENWIKCPKIIKAKTQNHYKKDHALHL